jgi:peptide subunit release factor 1 (eRF1)
MPTPNNKQLDRLAKERHGAPVVSMYLKLEPRDRERGKFLIKVKNRIKAAERAVEKMDFDRVERDAITADLARIQEHLANPGHLPHGQGLALFASKQRKLWEVVSLPVVHRSRLTVSRAPLVRELAGIEDDVGRLLVGVVDRTHARFFRVTAFDATELGPELVTLGNEEKPHLGRRTGSGLGEHTYHNRIRNAQQRHLENVAARLFELSRKEPFQGVILLGPGNTPESVAAFLHQYVFERLLGVGTLGPKDATASIVREAALDVRRHYEEERESAVVAELKEGVARGWAVNGVADTLTALAHGKVRTLLVHGEMSRAGFRLRSSGRLVVPGENAAWKGEGDPEPVTDVIDEALEEALRQRLDINVLSDAAAAKTVDGLGALLRFK